MIIGMSYVSYVCGEVLRDEERIECLGGNVVSFPGFWLRVDASFMFPFAQIVRRVGVDCGVSRSKVTSSILPTGYQPHVSSLSISLIPHPSNHSA
jgi:hypothetical protein